MRASTLRACASVIVTPAGSAAPGNWATSTYRSGVPAGAPVLSPAGPRPLDL